MSSSDEPRSPSAALLQMAQAYRQSAILTAACQLDVFTHLAQGPLGVEALAHACGLPARGLQRLLNACVVFDLLEKEGDTYRNTPIAKTFLVQGKPGYMGNSIAFENERSEAWGQLTQAIREDRPVNPHSADALDTLPPILAFTREIIPRHGMAERVSVRPGNYYRDEFGSSYDVLLFSNCLQTEGPQTGRMLLRKAFHALAPGGQLLIHGVMPDPDRVSPPQPALFQVQMFLAFPEGDAHPAEDICAWAQEVGFTELCVTPLPPPAFSSLITARKPA